MSTTSIPSCIVREPHGIKLSPGGDELFVCDTGHHRILAAKMQFRSMTGEFRVIAGGKYDGSRGYVDSHRVAALFDGPHDVVAVPGGLVVADMYNSELRFIADNGLVSTLNMVREPLTEDEMMAGRRERLRLHFPSGLARDAKRDIVYVSEFDRSRISIFDAKACRGHNGRPILLKIIAGGRVKPGVMTDGPASLHADTYMSKTESETGFVDGDGEHARFDHPTGMAVDRNGDLIIADTYNHAIRRLRWRRLPPSTIARRQEKEAEEAAAAAKKKGKDGKSEGCLNPMALPQEREPAKVTQQPQQTQTQTQQQQQQQQQQHQPLPSTQNEHITFDMLASPDTEFDIALTTIAGGHGRGRVDGNSKSAKFSFPSGVAVDEARGLIYVADYGGGETEEEMKQLELEREQHQKELDRERRRQQQQLQQQAAAAGGGVGTSVPTIKKVIAPLKRKPDLGGAIRRVDGHGNVTTIAGMCKNNQSTPSSSSSSFTPTPSAGLDGKTTRLNRPFSIAVGLGGRAIFVAECGGYGGEEEAMGGLRVLTLGGAGGMDVLVRPLEMLEDERNEWS